MVVNPAMWDEAGRDDETRNDGMSRLPGRRVHMHGDVFYPRIRYLPTPPARPGAIQMHMALHATEYVVVPRPWIRAASSHG